MKKKIRTYSPADVSPISPLSSWRAGPLSRPSTPPRHGSAREIANYGCRALINAGANNSPPLCPDILDAYCTRDAFRAERAARNTVHVVPYRHPRHSLAGPTRADTREKFQFAATSHRRARDMLTLKPAALRESRETIVTGQSCPSKPRSMSVGKANNANDKCLDK